MPDFYIALLAAVNHGGSSNSAGAITGNYLGAYLGLSAIPGKYTQKLELLEVITELTEDLCYDCQLNPYKIATKPCDLAWDKKSVYPRPPPSL